MSTKQKEDFQAGLWAAFREVQERIAREAEKNPHALEPGESPTDYANRRINAMTILELIDALS